MLSASELEQQLLSFVRERLAEPGVAGSITIDTRLFEDRVIDSLKILELIAFVQSALGRKIPDSQIVLANFRTIATIAQVFTAGNVTPAKRVRRSRGIQHPVRRTSAADAMFARGDMELTSEGAMTLRNAAASLVDYFDGTVRNWAFELGAGEEQFPDEISLGALDRAGFLSAFPQRLVRVNGAARPPAVCYHHYPSLAGRTIGDEGSLVTAIGRCYRNEFDANAPQPAERLKSFTMREIIAIGSAEFVERFRGTMLERVKHWKKELGLEGHVETANDPFFTDESRGRMLMQQILPLKYELRLKVDESGRTIAAASFNNHRQHFGEAFSIRLDSGEYASSGCVAFGWERWVIAFVNQHGPNVRNWPIDARSLDAAAAV